LLDLRAKNLLSKCYFVLEGFSKRGALDRKLNTAAVLHYLSKSLRTPFEAIKSKWVEKCKIRQISKLVNNRMKEDKMNIWKMAYLE
jgi:hypothetical protein